jgi:PAS domain S-box-containing protein
MKKILLLFFFLTVSFALFSQNSEIDSLSKLLKTSTGERKAVIFTQLQKKLFRKNNAQSILYGKSAIVESEKANLPLITLKALNLIGKTYLITAKYDSAQNVFQKELEIAQTIKNQKEIGLALHSIGNSYLYQENKEEALKFYQKALSVREKIQDTSGISASVNNIGKIYYDLKNYDFALIYFEKSLKYDELLNDRESLGASYNNVGLIYIEKKDYEKALYYLNHSKNIRLDIGDNEGTYGSLNNIGLVYSRQQKYNEALENYSKSYQLSHEAGNEWDETNTLLNISVIYIRTKHYSEAVINMNKGYEIAKRKNFKQLLRDYNQYFAEYYETVGDYKKANENLNLYILYKDSIINEELQNQILDMQTKYETAQKEKDILRKNLELKEKNSKIESQKYFLWTAVFVFILISGFLISIYKQFREKKRANILLENQNTEIKLKNAEIINQKEEISAQAEQLELINFELEKLSVVARETDNAIVIFDRNFEIEWVNNAFTKIYGYSKQEFIEKFGASILAASSNSGVKDMIHQCISDKKSVFYNSANKTRKGKDIWLQTTLTPIFGLNGDFLKLISIETDVTNMKNAEIHITRQNEMIKSSIRYAKTIQNAILPPKENLDKLFENFLIYRPKDIVSGDFYWISKVKNNESEKTIVAVVDCTGHGVPGALMSMAGVQLLNEIVKTDNIVSPCKILENLDIKVKATLHQYNDESNEGMDVCLCCIEKIPENQIQIQYCGAKRPLIYNKKTNEKINVLPGIRRGIGGPRKRNEDILPLFVNSELILTKGDIIYLSSDGLTDQNNSHREKFGHQRLIEALQYSKDTSFLENEKYLHQIFDEFSENQEQRDDITLLAIKL